MIKIFGGILVLLSSYIFGEYLTSKEKYALDDLYSFKKGLLLLKSEISYLRTSFSDAFLKVSKHLSFGTKEVFEEFSFKLENSEVLDTKTLWEESLENHKDKLYIDKHIIKHIKDFGSVLELQDLNAIISHINFLLEQIESEIEISKDKNEKTKKLYKQLSVLGGCLIVVVLM